MRIISLEAENLLNLRAVSITPDRRVIRITGKNGAGKSNVLNAMFYALAGKKGHAEEPIRRGTKRATVRVTLGDDAAELTAVLRITPTGSTLDVESPDGARFRSPQAMLDAIIGQLTFDPHHFERMTPKARLDTLRKLVKLDVDVDELDRLNERDYQLRTQWNHRVASFKERVETVAAGVDESMDCTPIDVSALLTRMQEAAGTNEHIALTKRDHEQRAARIREARERIERLMAEAQTLEEQTNREAMALAVECEAPLPNLVDVTALRHEIDEAQKTNILLEQQRRSREQLAEAERELGNAIEASKALTSAMDARTIAKESAMSRAAMPIAGLGFGNGDVTFDGLPFEQSSSGERLRVAVAIGAALNPTLRVLFVRDAALLDSEGLAILEQIAEERDFQFWLESTQDQPTVGIHIVDGAVAAIDGVPVGSDDVQELAEVGD